jgi:hypothetical protein
VKVTLVHSCDVSIYIIMAMHRYVDVLKVERSMHRSTVRQCTGTASPVHLSIVV